MEKILAIVALLLAVACSAVPVDYEARTACLDLIQPGMAWPTGCGSPSVGLR